MRRVLTMDESNTVVDVDNNFVATAESRCYYCGDNYYKNETDGYSFLFGGGGDVDHSTCVY